VRAALGEPHGVSSRINEVPLAAVYQGTLNPLRDSNAALTFSRRPVYDNAAFESECHFAENKP
jgi:hypothetical protein